MRRLLYVRAKHNQMNMCSMRGHFEVEIRKAQNEICAAVEELDGGKFHEDAWTRPGGGGGISRVLQVFTPL